MEEWHRIAGEAHDNKVCALLCEAIEQLPAEKRPPKDVIMTLVAQKEACETHYAKVQETLLALERLLTEERARHQDKTPCTLPPLPLQVVKGPALASLYPTPQHRTFCDIDIYTGPHTEALVRTVEQHGIACQKHNPRHATFRFHDVTIEAHRHLFFFNKDRRLYDNTTPLSMPPAWHALFVAAHACYDTLFFDYPVSLRTCLDWTLLLRDLDAEEMTCFFRERGGSTFARFADALTAYCIQLFPDAHLEPYFLRQRNVQHAAPGERDTALSMTEATAVPFKAMFCQFRPRSRHALARTWHRSLKYVLYNRYYKMLFGKNMFRTFYFSNLWVALRQHTVHSSHQ